MNWKEPRLKRLRTEELEQERRGELSIRQADILQDYRPTTNGQSRDERPIQVGDVASDKKPVSITIVGAPKLDILPFDGDVAHYPLFKKQVGEAVAGEK